MRLHKCGFQLRYLLIGGVSFNAVLFYTTINWDYLVLVQTGCMSFGGIGVGSNGEAILL